MGSPEFGPASSEKDILLKAIYDYRGTLLDEKAKAEAGDALLTFLDGYDIVSDTAATNRELSVAQRPDLIITAPTKIMQVYDLGDFVKQTDNFALWFASYTSSEAGLTPIAATKEEILELRRVPRFKTVRETVDYRLSSDLAGVGVHVASHHTTPAFLRMLLLFPEFTSDLVVDISKEAAGDRNFERFTARLFVAYQFMSRLADKNDAGVMRADGSVDNYFLCH